MIHLEHVVPLKILIPTVDYPPIEGGIGTIALQTARELAAQGHDVTVVAPFFPNMDDFDEGEPVTVLRYRGYGLGWFRFFPLLFATWPHVGATDVILGINIAYGGVIGWWARRLTGTRYVTFGYAYEFLKFRRTPLISGILRRAYAASSVVVAISTFTRDNLADFGVPAARIETIFPGAPAPRPVSDDAIRAVKDKYVLETVHIILAVGRFIPRKGHVTLVKALPKIIEAYPGAVLVLVGRGPAMVEATRQAHALGVREQVRLPGRLPDEDLAALYQACELFALPTGKDAGGQVEGFGLVFAEAHAYGKPVVAGRSGGVVDAVLDGETGILVDADDPEALADAIMSLMANPEKARQLGEKGKERVEKELNWRHFTERLMEALEARS